MGNRFFKFNCLGGGEEGDAWKAQGKDQDENPVYKLINLAKEGMLISLYEEEGPEALQEYVRQNVEPLLYGHGKGHSLTKAEYLRWKTRSEAKARGRAVIEIDKKSDKELLADFQGHEDIYNVIPDAHEVGWIMDQRGAVGETALHLLVLHNTVVTMDIAKILLSMYPKMAVDYYEADEYYGESALHIAIVYGDFEMVKLLVECGADVNQRATGRFFLPEDLKKDTKRTKKTNYEGYAYYGEYPLAFAACFGHEEIYDYLIDHGADPNCVDSFGNSVLHMMVISNSIGMFSYAVKHHAKKADMEISNHQNLTPLTLASKLGRNDIFKEIIELQSKEIWRYSNITCAMYPLAPLDTIGHDGLTNWSSALIYITDGESDDHLEILDGGVIKQLLDDKWKTYAKQRFFQQLVLAIGHLCMLSTAIYLRPAKGLMGATDTKSIIRYVAEIIVVTYCLVNTVFQFAEIGAQGFFGFMKNQASAPAKFIFNIACIVILLCVPARFLKFENAEMVLLSIAAPMSWFFMLFFARGFYLTGPFVIIIYEMCTGDLLKFGVIFIIFMFGFTPAFYFLFKDIEDTTIQSFKTIGDTLMQLIQMTFGEFKYEDFDKTRLPALTKGVFILFAILVPILLLNMLIAMMGNTYTQIIARSAKEWKRQWAKIIIVLERSYGKKKLLGFQEEYSMKMIGSTTASRGLMVIKTSKKTKARQRKGAIYNWKRLVKEIKALIKDQKEGVIKGPLDLQSNEITEKVMERQIRKHRSVMKRSTSDTDGLDFDDEGADGLISAINQLTWEHDIDLTKGQAFTADDDILEEAENASSNNNTARSSKPQTPQRNSKPQSPYTTSQSPQAEETPLLSGTPSQNSDSGQTPDELGMKVLNVRKRINKVFPEADQGPPIIAFPGSREGSGSSVESRKTSAKKPGPVAKGNAAKPQKKVFTVSKDSSKAAGGSFHSASSLTSLLDAWDGKDAHDQTNV